MEKMTIHLLGKNANSTVHNAPELSLTNYLRDQGWNFVSSQSNAAVILAIDAEGSLFCRPRTPAFSVNQASILIVQEPNVVWPNNSLMNYRASFKEVICLGRASASGTCVNWPVVWPEELLTNFSTQKLNKAVFIASNRLSFHEGELYSLRRRVVRSLQRVDTYGRDWNIGIAKRTARLIIEAFSSLIRGSRVKFSSAWDYLFAMGDTRGEITDKAEIGSRYKVSLVIENSKEYMSEKLMEALLSGSIPVYVGPEPKHFGIPSNLVVYSEPNLEAIQRNIDFALSLDFREWSISALEWLHDPRTEAGWSIFEFWKKLHLRLLEVTNSNL